MPRAADAPERVHEIAQEVEERRALLKVTGAIDRDDVGDERLGVAAQLLLVQPLEQRASAPSLAQKALPKQPELARQPVHSDAFLAEQLDQPVAREEAEVDPALVAACLRRLEAGAEELAKAVVVRQLPARVAHAVARAPAVGAHAEALASDRAQRALDGGRYGWRVGALRDE